MHYTESKVNYFVLDTSFLVDQVLRFHWTEAARKQIKHKNSILVIAKGVEKEWNRFMSRSGLERKIGCQEVLDAFFGNSARINYTDDPTASLSQRIDSDISDLGLAHKAPSMTDKTIIQAAYDRATEGSNVTIVTGDQAIHAQALNLWKSDGVDIRVISPWIKPAVVEGISFLAHEKVIESLQEIIKKAHRVPCYLAIAKGMDFGNGKHDIVFGWYLNKTYQFTPPKIEGVEYLRMVEFPLRVQPHTLGIDKMSRFGYYLSDDTTQIWILQRQGNITPTQINRNEDSKINFDYLGWARITDLDLKRHNPITSGKLSKMNSILSSKK